MKKVLKFVWKGVAIVSVWFYEVSGIEYVVEEIRSFVFRYKLRVRMVPVSYKLFILIWGIIIGSSAVFVHNEYPVLLEGPKATVWTFENVSVQPVQAKAPIVESTEKSIDELADYIWMKESTRGKKNYSKCEAIGKTNGIGYDIPGDGTFVCFDSHEEEMHVLKGWIIYRKALGWSELKMLCTYSGNNYEECKK